MEEVLKEALEIYKNKNKDYGNSYNDLLDEHGLIVAVIHLQEKLNRIKQLKDSESNVNESLEDSLMDAGNYAFMTVDWLREQEKDDE